MARSREGCKDGCREVGLKNPVIPCPCHNRTCTDRPITMPSPATICPTQPSHIPPDHALPYPYPTSHDLALPCNAMPSHIRPYTWHWSWTITITHRPVAAQVNHTHPPTHPRQPLGHVGSRGHGGRGAIPCKHIMFGLHHVMVLPSSQAGHQLHVRRVPRLTISTRHRPTHKHMCQGVTGRLRMRRAAQGHRARRRAMCP